MSWGYASPISATACQISSVAACSTQMRLDHPGQVYRQRDAGYGHLLIAAATPANRPPQHHRHGTPPGGHYARQRSGGINDNPRNSSDRVIEGVAKTGGLMGVTALDAFMTWSRKDSAINTGPYPPQATVARYVDEFDYLKRLIGIDHIALRTDFTSYIEAADPSQLFQFPPEMMYKQTPTIKYVDGFGLRPQKRTRRNGTSWLYAGGDREGFWWQLDARVPRSLERVTLET